MTTMLFVRPIRFSSSARAEYRADRPQMDGLATLGLLALHAGPTRTPEAELHMRGLLGSNRFDRQLHLVRPLSDSDRA
jgi:hypothetical protein